MVANSDSEASVATPTTSRNIQADACCAMIGRGDARVECGRACLSPWSPRAAAAPWRSAAEPQHQPGRDDDGDEEGEEHRGRGIGRDRRHVGPHQPGDEQHRQQRGDDRQRGDDGGVADLGHRLDRGLQAVRPSPMAQCRAMFSITTMASSTRMPIEKISANRLTRLMRVAHQPGGEEREQDRHRDDDERRPRASRQPMANGDQHDDRDRGEAEVEQELVGLLVGGLAVVAGDLDSTSSGISWPCSALEPVQRSSSATMTALAPARLAIARLTAGTRCQCRSRRARRFQTRCSRGLGPKTTVATSRT